MIFVLTVGISSVLVGRSWVRIAAGGKSFFLLQNIEAHFRSQTVSYSMSPIVICKQRVWGVVVTANLHLEARLRLSGAISLWKNFTVLPIPFIPNLCVCVCV